MSAESFRRQRRFGLLATGLFAVLALVVTAGPAQAQAKRSRTGDYNNYVKQLTARFNSWDTNGDKVLDKNELARAFRGPNAKAYDAGDDKLPPLSAQADKSSLKLLARQSMFVNKLGPPVNELLLIALARDFSTTRSPNVAAYATLPDYQFILLVGTTGLPKLTKQEYDGWARIYAGNLADYEEAQRKLKVAQNKYNTAKKPAQKQQYMAEVLLHQQEAAAAQTAISAIPQAIRAKLAVKL
jgi:hypothetical protein